MQHKPCEMYTDLFIQMLTVKLSELSSSGVKQSYGLWDETVPESGGARPAVTSTDGSS